MTLYSEIVEQPERIKSLLVAQKKTVEKIAAEIQKRDIQYVFLAARGTSDDACHYKRAEVSADKLRGLPHRYPRGQ
jgi:glucosamine--fructose-6-phosphate aminotransferase (isomerizing)